MSSPYLVPFDGSFDISAAATAPPKGAGDEETWEKQLRKSTRQLAKLQRHLYADDRFALLLMFQAMDAAGKDGTIRAVMSGVNPAGFQVFSFKKPSDEELDHDFLWRTSKSLPERGRIGIFNRSYYEEVLVVRVHPEFLGGQKLPHEVPLEELWQQRYESMRGHELHLSRNGIVVIKFFLNVSQEEQHRRFIARIDEQEKNWKFSAGDVAESCHWDKYMAAYQDALNATSREHAPWYCVPADDKDYMRAMVADVVCEKVAELPLRWPELDNDDREEMLELRKELVAGNV